MKEIEQIQEICKKFHQIKKATLFGSRARGDNNDRSDFDIAIYTSSNNTIKILNEISKVRTLLKIDMTIITPNTNLEKAFLDNIKTEEEVIYMSKFEKKYANLIKAIATLELVIDQERENQNEQINIVFRDSLIQRFEYCYELSWKTLREYMLCAGYEVGLSPRNVLEKAYQNSLIDNEEVWLDMISDRNISSHEYNENDVEDTAKRIKNNYILEFQALIQKLKEDF